ncbi:LOW QUALITY PROTEIN: uncharacterized protein LOC108095333 [Drosophila ficusphila]|uniref:LOW QUALITY PROTEIN: uncharacterized protein LOC108095333 n=1 Tax=Drosophila ficusphila TaxID=30025 RepID=UPI0007E85DB2|nr:LOW QUALITY PROTEIN: uncharacterized protein LOC108095333 [Drosophila ficusphila]
MNRNRINQMRQMDRGHEGLQQVIQMQATGATGGTHTQNQAQNQSQNGGHFQSPSVQTVRRKTTYTRTEMLSRGPSTGQNPRRSAPPAGQDWSLPVNQLSPKQRYPQPPKVVPPTTPLAQSTNVPNPSSTPRRQRSFLPRVARLPAKSPNRNPNRLRLPEAEGKLEQSQITLGSLKSGHFMNSPLDSKSSSPVRRTGGANGPVPGVPDEFLSASSSSSERHKIKLAKAIRLPDDQNKSFVYLCKPVKKVKDLLTVRRLRNSCEHLNHPLEEDLSLLEDSLKLQRTASAEALRSGGFKLLPLEAVTQSSSTSTSSQLDSPTLEALQLRQQQLEARSAVSQERLRSELREVRLRQRHLRQLEQDQRQREQRQLDLDEVCQNLPTLQHEIRMLQQLGEKLEATLRASNIPKPLAPAKRRSYQIVEDVNRQSSSCQFYTPRSSPFQPEELPITKLGCLRIEQTPLVQQRVQIVARAYHFGLVQEFRIETKTLTEMKKADDLQCFYLPAPREEPPLRELETMETVPLQRTNFRKLRENPNVLLQQLRPLLAGAGKPFNLLDQDQMFFNSLAYTDAKTAGGSALEGFELATRESGGGGGGTTLANYGGAIAYSRLSVGVAAGDQLARAPRSLSQVHNTTQTELESPRKRKGNPGNPKTEPKGEPEPEAETETELDSPDFTPNPSPRLAKRKKSEEVKLKLRRQEFEELFPKKTRVVIRRVAPEPPIQIRVEPKVRMQLLKTVLVGTVQVAVILVLIMAFTYPDVSC